MRPERDAELENEVYENETFRGQDLSGLRTTGCTFRSCDFTLAQVNGSKHVGSDFANSTFESANLGADLREATVDGVDLSAARVARTRLDLAGAIQLAHSLGAVFA